MLNLKRLKSQAVHTPPHHHSEHRVDTNVIAPVLFSCHTRPHGRSSHLHRPLHPYIAHCEFDPVNFHGDGGMRMGWGMDDGEFGMPGPGIVPFFETPKTSGTDVHPVLGVVRFNVRELGGDPDGQVGRTVGVMLERVLEDVKDPAFRRWVESRVPNWRGVTDGEKVQGVYDLVQNSIKFQRDEVTGEGLGGWGSPDVVETIVRPVDMVRYIDQGIAIGDCDDYSMLASACLTVLGVSNGFCTVAADDRDPEQYSHVYVVAWPVGVDGKRERMALDTSHGDYPGWEVPNRFGKRTEWVVWVAEQQPFNYSVSGVVILLGVAYAAYWLVKRLGGM